MPEELRPIGEISEVMVSVEGNPEQISTPQEREASSESPESEQGPEKTQESETNQLAERIPNKAGTVLDCSGLFRARRMTLGIFPYWRISRAR